jgi:hypothetical protein
MVDVEAPKSEAGSEKASSANFQVNKIIGKVRGFVDGLKVVSLGGQKLAVSVECFSFSVGQMKGKFDLKVGVSLAFTPKASVTEP